MQQSLSAPASAPGAGPVGPQADDPLLDAPVLGALASVAAGLVGVSAAELPDRVEAVLRLLLDASGAVVARVVLDDDIEGTERVAFELGGPQAGLAPALRLPLQAGAGRLGWLELAALPPAPPLEPRVALLAERAAGLLSRALAQRAEVVELEAAQAYLRSVLDEVTDVIVRIGPDGRVAFVNRAWTELTGISAGEMAERGALDSVHPEDWPAAAEHMRHAVLTREKTTKEVRFLAHDGSVRWMEVTGRAVIDPDGSHRGFTGMLHDVTERRASEAREKAAREEAERAREEAERASSAKTQFLSRMSHELRTPLTAILGFGQLLRRSPRLQSGDQDNVEHILRAGRHLLDLINDTLDISSVETEHRSLTSGPVDVRAVAAESLDLVRPSAAAHGIALSGPVCWDDGDPHVLADRQRLKQVLVNLLSNAVKYNHEGGSVRVECTRLSGGAGVPGSGPGVTRIRVVDTGIGIPEDRLHDIFVPFERAGMQHSEIEGTGVGLALVKSLAEAMGGRVAVQSTPGVGTAFTVDLPTAVAVPAVAQRPQATAPGPPSLPAAPVLAGRPTPDEPSDLGGDARTVLYIEDNPSNVTLVRRLLASRPEVRLLVAADGVAGLEMLRRVRPDLLLLDLHLPHLDGGSVLTQLRSDADPALRATPVVVVTADVTPEAERRVLAAGANAFVGKPLDLATFLRAVDEQLALVTTAA
ncbi:hybrid sensor histidine kinase/response regulator [Motilibacter aurantiacus]|uniref:hybrid sensor histidine kinase/response regulator n=1 Tax=Motilibacter aurantiacus TaxID=2714955 RepID=UPI0014090D12|nr:ATP-binding protein [Motilibacter aurantiacus]NHC44021.1 PAS domain S-box protein [Motilibacter aurantiacus]